MEFNQDKWGRSSTEVRKKYKAYISQTLLYLLSAPLTVYLTMNYFDSALEGSGAYLALICLFFYNFLMSFHGINICNHLEKEEKEKKQKEKVQIEKKETARKRQEERAKKAKEKKQKGQEEGEKKAKEKEQKKHEEREKKREALIEKYGKKFGEAVFLKNLLNGMTKEMVMESTGHPQYKNSEKWYYGAPFMECILFENNKVIKQTGISEGIWLDMPQDMLIASYGRPEDEKKEVSKKGTKLRWYYGGRETRQGTTAYSTEVRLENDLVVGWKELE